MKQSNKKQTQPAWIISATQMQPASLGWLFPVHCNTEFMWDEPERLNCWQILKEHDVKVPPLKNITLTHWFKRSFLLYIGYQPSKMTVASVSVVDFVTGGSAAWCSSFEDIYESPLTTYNGFPSLPLLHPALESNCTLGFNRRVEAPLQ